MIMCLEILIKTNNLKCGACLLAQKMKSWWFYCSQQSSEIDRYVAYDAAEGHWLIGNLSRTAGVIEVCLLIRLWQAN